MYAFTACPDINRIGYQFPQFDQVRSYVPVRIRPAEGDAHDIGMKLLYCPCDLVHWNFAAEIND